MKRTLIMGFSAILVAGMLAAAESQEIPQKPPKGPGDIQSPIPGPGPGPGSGTGRKAENLVRVRSMADVEQIRPGEKFHLAFIFDIEPHWHIYWANPGASGGPTTIEVSGPPTFAIGRTLYPRPMTIKGEEGTTYGYEKQAVIFVEVTAPPDLAQSSVSFNAKLSWMVCKDICLLGRTSQMVTVWTSPGPSQSPVKPGMLSPDPAVAEFKKRLPQPLKNMAGADAKHDGTTLTIKIPAGGKTTAELFPLEMPGVTFGEAAVSAQGQVLELRVPVTINPNDSLGKPLKIAGIVGLGSSPTEPCYEFDVSPAAP